MKTTSNKDDLNNEDNLKNENNLKKMKITSKICTYKMNLTPKMDQQTDLGIKAWA